MMNQRRYWTLCTILGALMTAPTSRAAADDAAALPPQVLAIFKESCASCHSPQAKKVKKFNYVLDLPKLVANPKYIIPGNPDKSLLYTQLVDDEMPPDDSDFDPLKPAQKETVKKWIAAGAPTGQPATTQSIAADPAGGHTGRAPRPFSTRLVIWLGKFHPLAAHTPIAVIMAAAIAEMLYLRRHAPALTHAARFCMVLGAMGAVATAALGWAMATTYSGADRAMLENHRWAGTIAAIASIPIALLGEWGAWRAHRQGHQWHGFSRKLFRVLVFMIAGLVGFTAHLGGLVHWGQNFFAFPK
jgi:mono/diheme cytochrome c family protein/uncharacterized membrane protein